jgi:hypothetical protein
MTMTIHLDPLPSGRRYEDQYGEWLKVFQTVAEATSPVTCVNPPWSWVPLLVDLGAAVHFPRDNWPCDTLVGNMLDHDPDRALYSDRTTLEVICGFRPETTDALWKADMQWSCSRRITRPDEKQFIVTNNGSFHRPEVLEFIGKVSKYKPTKRKVVLVPCAADKPYPSEMHKVVLDLLPPDYYLAIATGVLGIVPFDLWNEMPWYDSGLPNEWRLMNVAKDYFFRNEHDHIVVYADYYNLALAVAFQLLGQERVEFINEVKFYEDYLDLLDPARLSRLKAALDNG